MFHPHFKDKNWSLRFWSLSKVIQLHLGSPRIRTQIVWLSSPWGEPGCLVVSQTTMEERCPWSGGGHMWGNTATSMPGALGRSLRSRTLIPERKSFVGIQETSCADLSHKSTFSAPLHCWKRAILVAAELCGPKWLAGRLASHVWTRLGKHWNGALRTKC